MVTKKNAESDVVHKAMRTAYYDNTTHPGYLMRSFWVQEGTVQYKAL